MHRVTGRGLGRFGTGGEGRIFAFPGEHGLLCCICSQVPTHTIACEIWGPAKATPWGGLTVIRSDGSDGSDAAEAAPSAENYSKDGDYIEP
ncbi:hypothetical protein V501_04887 [Pseudogymnoascus sp. VKM F-4519 (FW-2642)]|nr:hypothetical protein V501_04887 [Pseudogymnoascus sp. VKM F-4519 (FW-2642)]